MDKYFIVIEPCAPSQINTVKPLANDICLLKQPQPESSHIFKPSHKRTDQIKFLFNKFLFLVHAVTIL